MNNQKYKNKKIALIFVERRILQVVSHINYFMVLFMSFAWFIQICLFFVVVSLNCVYTYSKNCSFGIWKSNLLEFLWKIYKTVYQNSICYCKKFSLGNFVENKTIKKVMIVFQMKSAKIKLTKRQNCAILWLFFFSSSFLFSW